MKNSDLYNLYFNESEEPLDNICNDGGFTAIFRKIACIGDSLSSGEFQCRVKGEPKTHYDDYYEYSWGQYIARTCGSEVYNFSKGGMTAMEYCKNFADARNLWDPAKKAQAYIIALGCNDFNKNLPIGSIADVHPEDWHQNAESFYGYLGQIISRYKEMAPDAKFFLMTMVPGATAESCRRAYTQAGVMYKLTEVFSNSYVIDLVKYGFKYDKEFRDKFYLEGHMNPAGYILTARIVSSYIDWIIRHNMNDFRRVGYINTYLSDSEVSAKEKKLEELAAAEAAKAEAEKAAPGTEPASAVPTGD